jgi:hypothetical protein
MTATMLDLTAATAEVAEILNDLPEFTSFDLKGGVLSRGDGYAFTANAYRTGNVRTYAVRFVTGTPGNVRRVAKMFYTVGSGWATTAPADAERTPSERRVTYTRPLFARI